MAATLCQRQKSLASEILGHRHQELPDAGGAVQGGIRLEDVPLRRLGGENALKLESQLVADALQLIFRQYHAVDRRCGGVHGRNPLAGDADCIDIGRYVAPSVAPALTNGTMIY